MSSAAPRPGLAYRRVPARPRRASGLAKAAPAELGVNSYRIHLLANTCHGLVVVALFLEALTILEDQVQAFARWHLLLLLALLLNGGVLLVQGARQQVRRWPVLVTPVLVVLAVLGLPLAWTGQAPPQDPWVEPFILLAAAATVVVWRVQVAVAFLVVVTTGYNDRSGHYVIVDHGVHRGVNLTTTYMHFQSAPVVASGQAVGQGQVVGHVGTTGSSTGCHLHFETRENGTPVNPRGWL